MSKKIGIITIHFGVNYGSVLQAYALTSFLNNHNMKAEVINYIPKRYGLWYNLYHSKKEKIPLPIIVGYYPFLCIKAMPHRQLFARFIKKELPLTKTYHSIWELKKDPPRIDVGIAGSDQIWNEYYNGVDETAYYLDFLNTKCRRLAYAASFGVPYPLSNDQVQHVSPYLQKFDAISVREDDGVSICNQCGVNATHVCDPVFLLTEDEWKSFGGECVFKEKYLLVYVMDRLYIDLLNNAEIIAREENLKIYVISFNHIRDKRINKQFTHCSPRRFISLFSNASFIVTNSFHGTAFSIIFRKRQLIIGKKVFNSRMVSLLHKAELDGRFILPNEIIKEEQVKYLLLEINGKDRYENLNNWIKESKGFLYEEIINT